MLLRFWNWLWHFITAVESIAFVLAALFLVLALAWGKNGAKKLSKAREAQLFKAAGYAALVKLALMAFTVIVEIIFYFKR